MTPNTTAGRKTKEEILKICAGMSDDQIKRDSFYYSKSVMLTAMEEYKNQFTPSPPTVFVAVKERIENRIGDLKTELTRFESKGAGSGHGFLITSRKERISELEYLLKFIEQQK